MILPTHSRLALAMRCLYPWSVDPRRPPRYESAASAAGTALSERAACLAVWGDYPGDRDDMAEALRPMLERDRATARAIYAEQPLAWCVERRAARWLPSRGDRDYRARRETEYPGTPDLVLVRDDGSVIVRDYKSGDRERGRDPQDHAQLLAGALCAASVLGVTRVTVQLVHVETRAWTEEAEVTLWDLHDVADQLRGLYDRIASGEASEPHPGQWCYYHYCPIVATCPAHAERMARMVAAARLDGLELSLDIDSDEQALRQWDAVRALEQALDAHKRAVQEYARTHVIEREPGKVLGWHERTEQRIDGRRALPVLRDMELDSAIEQRVTKASLKRAAKEAGLTERQVIEELTRAGAVSESKSKRFGDYRVKQ